MKLKNVDIIESPENKERVRLVGEVVYDDAKFSPELYWFEIPKEYKNFLTISGNPWLVCLLPLAMTLREPLEISQPIDNILLRNIKELMSIWKCWYPELSIIDIKARTVEMDDEGLSNNTAAFFSGGIDSFFTVLRHNVEEGVEERIKVDDLLTVWGFDVPLSNPEAFYRMKAVLQSVASNLGKTFIDISTNLRDTQWKIISQLKIQN